jgi:hypothetical protein
MSEIECPYCGEDNEHDTEQFEPSEPHKQECHHCEKTFVFTIEYYPSFTSRKADCLNGSEHNWRDELEHDTYMRQYFAMRRSCRDCEKLEYILAPREETK